VTLIGFDAKGWQHGGRFGKTTYNHTAPQQSPTGWPPGESISDRAQITPFQPNDQPREKDSGNKKNELFENIRIKETI